MPTWDNLEWHRCDQIVQQPDRIPKHCGAYAFRCAPGGVPRVIGRAFGPDKSGILCFGRTTNKTGGVRRRVTWFLQASEGREAEHIEGKRYYELKYAEHGFRRGDLEVGWILSDEPGDAKRHVTVHGPAGNSARAG